MPWTKEAEEWLALNQHLAAGHLARRVDEAVALLDLKLSFDSYLGATRTALGGGLS